jgi:hypothetical protein
MDADRVAALIQALSRTPSRRGVLGVLSGLGLSGRLGPQETMAKRKRKKHKKKHKKKHGGASPPPPPPPPPPPTGPGLCDAVAPASRTDNRRFGQTFLPPAGTQLTQASVLLSSNPAGFSLVFQIRSVDSAGVPGTSILASQMVSAIPATAAGGSPQQVDAIFATPATITPGQVHALTVTGPPGVTYAILVNSGNPCADGQLFVDSNADDTFVASPNDDLVFLVTVA